jgi:DNA primase
MVQEKDPKRWDEVIIDSPFAKLTKRDVHEYYSTPAVQKKILDAVGDREAILRQSFTADKTVLRRKDEAGELIRLNKEQLDKWNAKRLSEVHPTFGRKTDVLLADIDPQEGVDWRHTKKITETVAKTMQSRPEVRDVSIRFSGGRGFYVEGKLTHPSVSTTLVILPSESLMASLSDTTYTFNPSARVIFDWTPLRSRTVVRYEPHTASTQTLDWSVRQ